MNSEQQFTPPKGPEPPWWVQLYGFLRLLICVKEKENG